jgi:phosphatidylserine decarboxylase
MMGRLADLDGPPALVQQAISTFVRVYGVALDEADVPHDGFSTFDAFFTRRLKAGARGVDTDPNTVVCPSDGRLLDAGPIDTGATFRVKGRLYDAAELLGDAEDARAYDSGSFAIVYLAPPDYHRVHAPATGRVTSMRHVPGTLFPVNRLGIEHIPNLFVANERIVVHQESDRFGPVATILVGAIGVGRISVSFDDVLTNSGRDGGLRRYGDHGPVLGRGDELGMFHLGSTVIVMIGGGARLTPRPSRGERVRMGTPLLVRGGA